MSLSKLFISTVILTAIATTTVSSPAHASRNSQLTVQVTGLRDQRGQVCLSLFANPDGFPGDGSKAVQSRCVPITTSTVSVTFEQLSPGSYAVAILHDANRDAQANRNFLGIPIEGFGFSRNPTIRMGPPGFEEAAVQVSGSAANIQVRMNYLR